VGRGRLRVDGRVGATDGLAGWMDGGARWGEQGEEKQRVAAAGWAVAAGWAERGGGW
jgi:hypothetical protein